MLKPFFCPWNQDQKVVEIGGGPGLINSERPIFRPNVEGRAGPMVDIVHDLEQTPWPLNTLEWDGVYSSFFLEHVSHKLVRNIIAEMYRILAPGGIAIVVTADTFAQCEMIVAAGPNGLTDTLVNMLFGGGDYHYNFHKCGFSRPQVEGLFREAGFWHVEVHDHPGIIGPNGYEEVTTDMIVEAHKSSAVITHGFS